MPNKYTSKAQQCCPTASIMTGQFGTKEQQAQPLNTTENTLLPFETARSGPLPLLAWGGRNQAA